MNAARRDGDSADVRGGVSRGFARAWTAIWIRTSPRSLRAVVLFYFGTGPIKGFALTLGIGVILSLFSAISVTRLFMWSVAKFGETHPNMFAGKIPEREAVLMERGSKG